MSSAASGLEQRYGRLALTVAAASILVALLVLAGLAWAYTATSAGSMAMSAAVDLPSLALFVTTWVVMMAAMMFPSIAPVVLVYAQYTRRQGAPWALLATLFVAGYLVVWGGVGIIAWAIVAVLVPPIAAFPAVQEAPQLFLGAVLASAGAYQLTPLKNACLGHCRSPMHWLFLGFRPGRDGALRMGLEEGVFCVGCCAGLMVVLLAVGLASVGWMAVVAAVIFVEKVLAPTAAVARAVGILLIGFGIAVATIAPVAGLVLGSGGM